MTDSEKTPRPVLVVHPIVWTKKLERQLEKDGYLVVVSDNPEHIRFLDVVPIAFHAMLAQAAFTALNENEQRQRAFGVNVLTALLKVPVP